jgi:decaprenylphospho-beta-D-erythro-pentofuranosid-2-ulose 2-reductase
VPHVSTHENILVIGATSAIAEATARLWATAGVHIYLVARSPEKLALVARDLETRGARVTQAILDVNDFDRHAPIIEAAFRALLRVDVVLIAHGDLPDQRKCEGNAQAALAALQSNATSAVSLLTLIANRMQTQGSGVIAVIGSVAGDRGRRSNYVYGSSKALVAVFAQGLADRLDEFGVRVITIKPGWVDTPMTASFTKGRLWVGPESVATQIHARIAAARSGSYYVPRFWWLIMAVVRCLPDRIIRRLNI